MEPRLAPPATKGHLSVARLTRGWYVACRTPDLRTTPIARTILGIPMVVFRDGAGRAAALLDRCPHRNAPLALGRVGPEGHLACGYHGWQFDRAGACRHVPGLIGDDTAATRRVSSFAVHEKDGFVWVWAAADEAPATVPFTVSEASDPSYVTIVRELELDATLHAVVENALDVPHTAFLHRGLFRGGAPHDIVATVRRTADRVECEYGGEPRPEGFIGRLLAPGGGIVEHWDRFILPSIAQVEYRLGSQNHLVVNSLCTPISDTRTRMFAVVSLKLRAFTRTVGRLVQPLALRILRQDQAILTRLTETVRRFGGEQYMSTELDLVGPHVWRLLRQAEAGGEAEIEAPVTERQVRFRA